MAVVVILLSLGVDLLIRHEIRANCPHGRRAARWYMLSAVLCWIFLAVVLCIPRRQEGQGILTVMWCLYSYMTVYVAKAVYALCALAGSLPRLWRGRRRRTGLWIGLPLGVLVFCMMWWGAIWGRREIEVTHLDFARAEVPEAFDGYRIVQFSDAHVGTWGDDTSFIDGLVDSINSLHPDMIVFTGDVVNRETSEIEPFIASLSRLYAPDGVYSILGNHDYGDYCDWSDEQAKAANNARLAEIQKSMGWRLLNNGRDFITRRRPGSDVTDTLVLIGVENWGEPPFKQYGDLNRAYPMSPDSQYNVNDSRFKILLSHNPEHWRQEVSGNTNINLTLSGHTHAMQIMLGLGDWRWSPSKYRYEEWGGLYTRPAATGGENAIYVNIGSGEVGMPFRLGATPEVTEITLRHTGR